MAKKSLQPAIAELENMYDYLVDNHLRDHFKYEIQRRTSYNPNNNPIEPTPPVIIVQQQGRRKTLAWWTPKSWENVTTAAVAAIAGKANQVPKFAEISIATELLGRPNEEVFSELAVVAYAHWFYFYKGWYGSGNQFFSKRLGDDIRGFGVTVNKQGGLGFRAVAQVAPRLTNSFKAYTMKDPYAFRLVREHDETTRRTGSPLKKWTCGCTIIRATAYTVSIKCQKCHKWFVYADHDAVPFHQQRFHTAQIPNGAINCTLCEQPGGANCHVGISTEKLYA